MYSISRHGTLQCERSVEYHLGSHSAESAASGRRGPWVPPMRRTVSATSGHPVLRLFLRRFLIELGASTWPSWTMRIAERTGSSEEAWYELKGIDDDDAWRCSISFRT